MDVFKKSWANMQYCKILRVLKILCSTFVVVFVTWRLILFLSFGDDYCKSLIMNKVRATSYDSNFIQCINNAHKNKTYFRGFLENRKRILFVGNAVMERIFQHFLEMFSTFGEKGANKLLHYIPTSQNRSQALSSPLKFWTIDSRNWTNFGRSTENCSLNFPSVLVFGEPQEKHLSLSIIELEDVSQLVPDLTRTASWSECYKRNFSAEGKLKAFEIRSTQHPPNNDKMAETKSKSTEGTRESERIARYIFYLMADEVPGCCKFFKTTGPGKRRGILFLGLCLILTVISKTGQMILKKLGKNENSGYSPSNASKTLIHMSRLQNIAGRILANSEELSSAFTKFGLVMFYLYLVDCTNFMVHQKRTLEYGLLKQLIILYLGLTALSVTRSEQAGVNDIRITREWRGWMQLYIIHMHRSDYGNRVLLGYALACICVSAYLFLSGYGHFCYFWSKPGLSYPTVDLLNCGSAALTELLKDLWRMLSRYLQVAFRLTFLVLFVTVMTDQPFGRFYFMSLTVLWFTIFTVTMSIYSCILNMLSARETSLKNEGRDDATHYICQSPDINQNRRCPGFGDTNMPLALNAKSLNEVTPAMIAGLPSYRQIILPVALMTGKTLALILLIHLVCRSSSTFQKAWTIWPLKFIFAGRSERYWGWRISNDAYSFIYGILFGLAVYSGKLFSKIFCRKLHRIVPGFIEITEERYSIRCFNLLCALPSSKWNKLRWNLLQSVLMTLGIVMLYLSIKRYLDCGYPLDMHKLNIRFCVVPIISYIIIRNSMALIRRHHSAFLARMGDISLELYVIHQVERDNVAFIPNTDYKFINELLWVTTLIAFSDEVHSSTKILGKYLVPRNFQTALWLLPICVLGYKYMCIC